MNRIPRPAVLHFQEALVGIGLVVSATNGVVLGWANACAAGVLEARQTALERYHEDVFAADKEKYTVYYGKMLWEKYHTKKITIMFRSRSWELIDHNGPFGINGPRLHIAFSIITKRHTQL